MCARSCETKHFKREKTFFFILGRKMSFQLFHFFKGYKYLQPLDFFLCTTIRIFPSSNIKCITSNASIKSVSFRGKGKIRPEQIRNKYGTLPDEFDVNDRAFDVSNRAFGVSNRAFDVNPTIFRLSPVFVPYKFRTNFTFTPKRDRFY